MQSADPWWHRLLALIPKGNAYILASLPVVLHQYLSSLGFQARDIDFLVIYRKIVSDRGMDSHLQTIF